VPLPHPMGAECSDQPVTPHGTRCKRAGQGELDEREGLGKPDPIKVAERRGVPGGLSLTRWKAGKAEGAAALVGGSNDSWGPTSPEPGNQGIRWRQIWGAPDRRRTLVALHPRQHPGPGRSDDVLVGHPRSEVCSVSLTTAPPRRRIRRLARGPRHGTLWAVNS
jgi:hypothetical protein